MRVYMSVFVCVAMSVCVCVHVNFGEPGSLD